EKTPERGALSCVVNCLRGTLPHEACGAHRIVKACVDTHLENRLNATTFLSYEQAVRGCEFHFARGVGMIPELGLQPLQMQRVDGSIRQKARHEETRQPTGGLRETEKRIAHRCGAEPLMPGETIFMPRPPRL